MRAVLDQLGDASEIAPEAHEPRSRCGALDAWALILLPVGGMTVPILRWAIGVVLLWTSDAWTTREKLAGALNRARFFPLSALSSPPR